jgi:hypothetical protein
MRDTSVLFGHRRLSDHAAMFDEPIHVSVPARPLDPRYPAPPPPEGVVVHYVPELHPDDVTVVRGIPVTTPSRTLIDRESSNPDA